MEKSEHEYYDYVTLTYEPEKEPESLVYDHFKLFLQRLRYTTGMRVRYFVCGEYGGKNGRPHWHVLLYGYRFTDRGMFHTETWPFGHVWTDELVAASANYVAKYTLKSSKTGDDYLVGMSRRPGIGMSTLRYVAKEISRISPAMPYFPPIMKFEGRSYWMDKRSYEACVKSYLDNGGDLEQTEAPVNPSLDEVSPMPVDATVREYMRAIRGTASF